MTARFFALLVAATSLAAVPARADAELDAGAAPTAAPEASAPAPAATPTGSIARSTFTTAVVDREPQDSLTTLTNDRQKVFYFTELKDFAGTTVTHRWEHNGEPVAEVFFEVKGPRWRVYSSKNLPTDALGEWSVSVVDDMNRVLRTESFRYEAAPAPPSASAVEPEPPSEALPAALEEPAPAGD